MKVINDFLDYLQGLSKKDYERFLLVFLGTVVILAGGITYYIYAKANQFEKTINNLRSLVRKMQPTINNYNTIQQKRRQLLELLEQEKEFEIKSFFEKFCRERGIKPESDWSTPINRIPGNDQLIEITLRATFRRQTTEKMVNLLNTLAQKKIVYIKALRIAKIPNTKEITFELTIANLAFKQSIEI